MLHIFYKMYQNNIKTSKNYKKWYARAKTVQTVGLAELATMVEANCTAQTGDVRLVLESLVKTMRHELQNGHRLKLDGLGSFSIRFSTKPSDNREDFNIRQCVHKLRVQFQPETRVSIDGKHTKTFLENVSIIALPSDAESTSDEGGSVEP